MNEAVSANQLPRGKKHQKNAPDKLQKNAEAKNYTRPFQCKDLKTFIFRKICKTTNFKGAKKCILK